MAKSDAGNDCWRRHVPILLICLTLMGILAGILFAAQRDYDERLRTVEQQQAAQQERDQAIKVILNEIKVDVRELRKKNER